MSKCKYCNNIEDKQSSPCLSCQACGGLVHLECLGTKTPGAFLGDTFFSFTCSQCTPNKEEILHRGKISWFHCLLIVLYNLKTKCHAISNQGYFHWRTHIGAFIVKNWNFLFDPHFKMKKNWAGTLSGTLSQYSPIFFKSGSDDLNQSGWWKLSHDLSPSVNKYIYSDMILMKQNEKVVKSENQQASKETDHSIFLQLVNSLGYSHLLNSNDAIIKQEIPENRSETEMLASQSDPICDINNDYMYKNDFQTSTMDNYLSNYFPDGDESMSDFDSIPPDFEEYSEMSCSSYTNNEKSNYMDLDVTSNNYLSFSEHCDVDNILNANLQNKTFPYSEESNDSRNDSLYSSNTKVKNALSTAELQPVKSLFSQDSEDNKKDVNSDLPWMEEYQCPDKNKSLVFMTEYEEIQMLNYLNNICRKKNYNVDKRLIRLRAKLALRKLKRNKHILPEWNLDGLACQLAKFPIQDYMKIYSQRSMRVLDRYQQITKNLSGATVSSNVDFATRLVGTVEVAPFLSPYSGRFLKPYIRRDFTVISPWTKLMHEMMTKVNGLSNHPSVPLDYCYVRPQFIPSINSLCEQHFWPGIDLTETLQYPDFSCIVLYKKLIVGFAFLVPDIGHNEAYVSFIFTRPQWRRSGIAKFMLYHLIQTCIHKDITLHVSATNPSILLYQKFGFKIEELVQDFYDKYFAPDSMECKHALFLRLCR